MATAEAEIGAPTVEVDLRGVRALPHRFAVGVLSLETTFWGALAVLAPLSVLATQLFWPVRPRMLVFVPGFVCFALWMAPMRYDRSQTTVDSAARVVRIERPTGTGEETADTYDLEKVDRAEIRRLGSVALVHLRSGSETNAQPDFLVSTADLPIVIDALDASGLDVDSSDVLRPAHAVVSEPLARLAVTALFLLGVPIVGVSWFGPGILVGGLGGLLLLIGGSLLVGWALRRLISR